MRSYNLFDFKHGKFQPNSTIDSSTSPLIKTFVQGLPYLLIFLDFFQFQELYVHMVLLKAYFTYDRPSMKLGVHLGKLKYKNVHLFFRNDSLAHTMQILNGREAIYTMHSRSLVCTSRSLRRHRHWMYSTGELGTELRDNSSFRRNCKSW